MAMNWYLVHTKPMQERSALENLQRQGYECYFPVMLVEKLRLGKISTIEQPLFPRYLFIRLGQDSSAKSWTPIRSTKGVSRLVTFGSAPAKVNDELVVLLRSQEEAAKADPAPLYKAGEKVRISSGPFVDLEGIYQMMDGDQRTMVLIELISKPVKIMVSPSALKKLG